VEAAPVAKVARNGQAGAHGVVTQPKKMGRPRLEEPSDGYLTRRNDIIDVAARVFHAKGYEAGSLSDVADALDLRKASLYYYVKSKAELLFMVFDRAISRGLEELEAVGQIEDPRQRLIVLIRHQALIIASDPGMYTVFFDDRPRLDAAYEKDIAEKERRYLQAFSDAVSAAVEAGVVPAVDPRYAGQAILGMTTWIYKWIKTERDDPAAFADTCVRLLLGEEDAAPAEKVRRARRA
jgi:TetR/AcrR family transcriptional regulator, cholesterol catabolism regulator